MNYETTHEVEMALSKYFDPIKNVIVPNVSWGMFSYELDLCILNCKSRYATEVEIKVSVSDLKRDAKKTHQHDRNRNMIKYLWFAMPEKMKGNNEFVPDRAGIMLVDKYGFITVVRTPQPDKLAIKWNSEQSFKLARLASIRMWKLKQKAFLVKK